MRSKGGKEHKGMSYDSIILYKLYVANKNQWEEPNAPPSGEFPTLARVLEQSLELPHRTRLDMIKAEKKN